MELVEEDPHEQHERLVPFLGSAVSLFEPTSLPTWTGFVEGVVSGLDSAAGESAAAAVVKEASAWQNCRKTLDVVVRRLGVKYLEVMRGVLERPANQVHSVLVDNIAKGKYPAILTTNFDRVIEDTLMERGMPICELRGRNAAEDSRQLDRVMDLDTDDVRTVVVTDPKAFGALDRMPGLVGNPKVCLLLKLHGDAKYPITCVDTDIQRELGLPAAVRSTLSVLLRRYPMFFIGWGGGDLEGNRDYTRLESEADSAIVYWFIRQGTEPPEVLTDIKDLFESQGGTFKIIQGNLKGSIQPSTPFLERTKKWAVDIIGSKWAKLVMKDLEKVYGGGASLSVQDRMKEETTMQSKSFLRLLPKPLIHCQLSEDSRFSQMSTEMLTACVSALDLVRQGRLSQAWTKSVLAIRNACAMLPKHDLRFADSWAPFATAALVQASNGADPVFAYRLWRDSQIAAQQAGNLPATKFLESSELGSSLKAHCFDIENQEEDVGVDVSKENVPEDSLQVFLLDLDNTSSVSASGIPQDKQIRAEIFRGILAGDVIAIPKQSLLNSRVLITEVLSNMDGKLHDELLELIQPMLESDAQDVEHPILMKRQQIVENVNFLHEEIPMSYFEDMDEFYTTSKSAPRPLFYSVGPIGNNYMVRMRNFLGDSHFAKILGVSDARTKAEVKHIAKALFNYIDAISHQGEKSITRSDVYRWANLFKNNPSTDDDIWSQANMDDRAKKLIGSKSNLSKDRQAALAHPWRNAELLKSVADAAYVTNLPIHLRLSIVFEPGEGIQMMKMTRKALSLEKSATKLPKDCFVSGSVDLALLASLTVKEVLNLRNSEQGVQFRTAAKKYRSTGSIADKKAAKKAADNFLQLLRIQLTLPSERALPAKLKRSASNNPIQISKELLKETCDGICKDLVSHYARPPPPLYETPRLSFPGLMVLLSEKASDEEMDEEYA